METKAATPIKIGSKTLKNRVTFAPTVKYGRTDGSGIPIDRFRRHYEERAAGGCGLICVEATCVEPQGRLAPTQLGLWDDSQIPGNAAITAACHAYGTVMLVQLHHAGGTTHPECGEPWAPSAVELRGHRCKELSVERIHEIQQKFIAAALRAKAAGYDGVQLHACHAYLINQFISPEANRRTDEYGGSVENRARFGCEIIRGIREACGPDFIISPRHSASEETFEDCCAIASLYVEAGADYLQISNGITQHFLPVPEGFPGNGIVYLGSALREAIGRKVPVSVVNGIAAPEQARALIDGDYADTVDLAKALLADPLFARAVTDGTPYVACRKCKTCLWSPHMPHNCPALTERRRRDGESADWD